MTGSLRHSPSNMKGKGIRKFNSIRWKFALQVFEYVGKGDPQIEFNCWGDPADDMLLEVDYQCRLTIYSFKDYPDQLS